MLNKLDTMSVLRRRFLATVSSSKDLAEALKSIIGNAGKGLGYYSRVHQYAKSSDSSDGRVQWCIFPIPMRITLIPPDHILQGAIAVSL